MQDLTVLFNTNMFVEKFVGAVKQIFTFCYKYISPIHTCMPCSHLPIFMQKKKIGTNMPKGSSILERKRRRKRRRLELIHSLPMYVFILGAAKMKENCRFRFRSNIMKLKGLFTPSESENFL